jgi:L,D-peptidoglycan transpeptidase YkuD (ErfK/YbiS/YcfS/YnhG family)
MNRVLRPAAASFIIFALTAAPGEAKYAPACPGAAKDAEKLVLVLSASMSARAAKAEFFERGKDGRWTRAGKLRSATLGKNGLGWAWTHKRLATRGQPVKREGDGKTPAGFFGVGKPFGFASSKRSDYVRLKQGENYCVDDPDSAQYNSIIPRAQAGNAKGGEDMGTIEQYREGLFVNYPTNRALKGGSCIFIHIWRGEGSATAGCVAMQEADIVELQQWSEGAKTVIGILPETAWRKLHACFRGL